MAQIVISRVELRYWAVLAVQSGDRVIEVAHRLGVSPQSLHSCRVQLPGPLAVGGQIGPGVARLGVGQGLLVPVRVARSWEAEHRPLPGRGPLDDLEPVLTRRALGPGDPAGPARCPHIVVGEERKAG